MPTLAPEPGNGGTTTRTALVPVMRLVPATIVYAIVLLGCAGTLNWPAAWLYLAVMTVVMAAYTIALARVPELILERTKPPKDAKNWDRPLVALIGAVGPIALIVVAGLDHRFGWTGPVSAWWLLPGLVLVVAGSALTHRAVAANRFFSALVRIQRDRGHQVVDAGPYHYVRHPGYLGSLLHMPGAAIMLQSWWAMAVVAAVSALVVFRTALEDRTLLAELDGYGDYAARVRYRLVPGVW